MFEFQVSVPFVPRWQHIELLRTAVLNCLTAIFQAHDFSDRLAMVAAELLENAIHYGRRSPDDARQGFRLDVRGAGDVVTIEVRNPGGTESRDMERLDRTMRRLVDAPDARAAYLERLQELAANPDLGGSGLGLLRIAYETGCELTARVDEHGLVCVRAVVDAASVPPRSASEHPA